MPSTDHAGDDSSQNISELSSVSGGGSGSEERKRSGIFGNGFEAYRTVTGDDYRSLFTTGLIVLDANVLLNLYRYHPETRQELLDVLDRLRERLWVPNQAMAEFWARRESVLEDSSDVTSIVNDLNKLGEQYMSRIRQWANRAGLRQQTTESLAGVSRSAFEVTISKIRSLAVDKALKAADDTAKDPVVTRLDSILQGHVGNPLTPERRRTAIKAEGPERFAERRPPGYMDANKKNDNSFGDYLVWIETLEEAARLKVDVLFVTGDIKEDWWRQERGQSKGPHPQLVEEMRNVAGVRLFMLRPESLLKHAGDLLQVKVSPESVQDAQRVTANAAMARYIEIEDSVVLKLKEVFGDSSVQPSSRLVKVNGRRVEVDAIVRLAGKAPVFFEIKYTSNPGVFMNRLRDALWRINGIARAVRGLGVLILILPDALTPAEIEQWTSQLEGRVVSQDHSGLYTTYVARYADFLAEPAKDFAERVIPHDMFNF
jgi:PIN like domain